MIIRSYTRPLLRGFVSSGLPALSRQTRCLHRLPVLPHQPDWERHGIAGLMTPQTFKVNWLDYQSHLCTTLNQKTQGTVDESLSPRLLLAKYSHTPTHADLFNTASQAVNNYFFFESLSSLTTDPAIHKTLQTDIKTTFDDIDHLRIEMLEAADAIFGNGYVWLMKDALNRRLRVLCTYNAGSPFKEAHYRQQYRDMANASPADRLSRVQNTAGTIGDYSRNRTDTEAGALKAEPLLCINCWQHSWIPDYGLMGKRVYLASWWERINWAMVNARAEAVTTTASSVLTQSLRNNYQRRPQAAF